MLYQPNLAKLSRPRLSLKRQCGVVIVVALFFVALVAAMAVFMMTRLLRDTQRTQLVLRDFQAENDAQGSVVWAMDQLNADWVRQKSNQRVDATPIELPDNEVHGYHVRGKIDDMQARFNINNLKNSDTQSDFQRLVLAVNPSLNEESARQLIRAVTDWISPVSAENEFSRYYAELPQAYRAAHRPMAHISELRLVKGMTPALYQALLPYVTALPSETQVNPQTASAPVLLTLSPAMTLAAAKAIETIRVQTPITSAQAFQSMDIIKNHPIPKEKVVLVSTYFLVETEVSLEDQHLVLYTLLERSTVNGRTQVSVIWQSKGVP